MSQKKAEEYLKLNPQVKEVFSTADGFLFLVEQQANVHAKTLKNTKVNKVGRKKEITKKVEEPKTDKKESKNEEKESKKVEEPKNEDSKKATTEK